MKLYAKILYTLLILFLLTLSGCSSKPIITDSWIDENYDGRQFGKILVIGAAEKITFRNLYEGELVQQLQNKGIEAIPSYEILPYNNMLTREIVLSAIEKSDIDSVLITSLVDRSQKTIYYAIDNSSFYSYYSGYYKEINKNVKTASYEIPVLHLKTNLYDVRSEKLIWSMTSESEYKYNIKSINSAIALILERLREDGLI